MILLQTNFDPHRKKESLTKLFKLACLYQPEKSLVFVSYISNYEPKYENMEEIKEEEKCELEGPKEREEIEEDYQ